MRRASETSSRSRTGATIGACAGDCIAASPTSASLLHIHRPAAAPPPITAAHRRNSTLVVASRSPAHKRASISSRNCTNSCTYRLRAASAAVASRAMLSSSAARGSGGANISTTTAPLLTPITAASRSSAHCARCCCCRLDVVVAGRGGICVFLNLSHRSELRRAIDKAYSDGHLDEHICVFTSDTWTGESHQIEMRSMMDCTPLTLPVDASMNVAYDYFKRLGLRYILIQHMQVV